MLRHCAATAEELRDVLLLPRMLQRCVLQRLLQQVLRQRGRRLLRQVTP